MTARSPEGLLLFGFKSRALDAVATVLVASTVVVSRFGFLANGPWEWDETLFARGILHFELAAHFPHPPGFPGWLAIGHLLTPLTGDPLLALQLASAAFSVAALWVLAALGRRVAPPVVAVAAALAMLAAPGPWLYAVRGFSTTAASVLALAAAAVLAGGLKGHRITLFTVLVSAAFLVRPHLLPALAALWIGGVWSVRPLRRLLPGVGMGVTGGVISILLMARAEGGWSAFVAPFLTHSRRHFSRLVGNLGAYPDLGLVKGLGGVVPATVIFALAVAGLVVWARRRGKRAAVLWLVVLGVAAAQLVWLQNRTYSRYAVGVQMALAPLVAAAAATVPPAVACAGLLGLTGWFGVASLPPVEEQHTTQLPGWQAVRRSLGEALDDGRVVVIEPELHPFASYLWHLLEARGEPTPQWVLSPWDPQPWPGVDRPWLVVTVHRQLYPGLLSGVEEHWGGVSQALEPLTQQRFLEAWVLRDVALPIRGWWPAEIAPNGRRYMWCGADAELLLPPLASGSEVGLALRPLPGPDPVAVRWADGDGATVGGASGETWVWLNTPPGAVGRVSAVNIERERGSPPGGDDPRPLAVQVFEVRVSDPAMPWSGPVAQPWQREALRIEIQGDHGPEVFQGVGEGIWLKPQAVLKVPSVTGILTLRLSAPRPTPSRTRLRVGDTWVLGPVDLSRGPMDVAIAVAAPDDHPGLLEIEIVSDPYIPAEDGADDSRRLGAVLSWVEFVPAPRDLDAPQGRP